MRRQYILFLISRMPDEPPVQRPSSRPMFKSSHRNMTPKNGKADPEMVRQLVLSMKQEILLNAGYITWAGLNLTPFIATLPREVIS